MKPQFFMIFAVLTFLSACEGALEVPDSDGDRGTDDTIVLDTNDTEDTTDASDKADTVVGNPSSGLTGQELYVRDCGTCHGDDGLGAQAWPLSIQGFFPIYGIVVNGQGDMGSISSLSAEEIGLVQQFLLDMDM